MSSDKIPTSKIARATRVAGTTLRVGGNFVKHYAQKIVTGDADQSALDEANAGDIYSTLSDLKGSALKIAQMLSMDQGMLPAAYARKFSEAQHKAPPLSGPLIVQTFRKHLGKSPLELYDSFEMQAAHAASIGQVHRAAKNGQPLAIKIQYPGVADAVVSDMNLVKPLAKRLFGWGDMDMGQYFQEIQDRLIEETDYSLEIRRGQQLTEACAHLPGLRFPTYFPELSCGKVITMSWMEGQHLEAWLETQQPDQATRNRVGQALWDFYNYQLHQLRIMHADAHPGNYLFQPDGTVIVLDFGCVKEIPEAFYQNYFSMLAPENLHNDERFRELAIAGEMLLAGDSPEEQRVYMQIFREAIGLVARPFQQPSFDFGDDSYFAELYAYGNKAQAMPELRNSRAPRGSKDGLYMNRTYFGLFSILNMLRSQIETQRYMPKTDDR